MTALDFDDDDVRRYDDPSDDPDDDIDYGDICPRCFELWRDCICEDDFREDRDEWNADD